LLSYTSTRRSQLGVAPPKRPGVLAALYIGSAAEDRVRQNVICGGCHVGCGGCHHGCGCHGCGGCGGCGCVSIGVGCGGCVGWWWGGCGGGPGGGPGGLGMLPIDMPIRSFTSASVLLITNVLHPIDDFPHQSLLNGNVRHRLSRRRAMPMLLTR
jgi:hypothetical protein